MAPYCVAVSMRSIVDSLKYIKMTAHAVSELDASCFIITLANLYKFSPEDANKTFCLPPWGGRGRQLLVARWCMVARWYTGRALDSWSRGHWFNSDRGQQPWASCSHPMCLCSPSSIIWYLVRAFMLKAPYCWQRHRVQWTRGYCRAVLRWSSDCIDRDINHLLYLYHTTYALLCCLVKS